MALFRFRELPLLEEDRLGYLRLAIREAVCGKQAALRFPSDFLFLLLGGWPTFIYALVAVQGLRRKPERLWIEGGSLGAYLGGFLWEIFGRLSVGNGPLVDFPPLLSVAGWAPADIWLHSVLSCGGTSYQD